MKRILSAFLVLAAGLALFAPQADAAVFFTFDFDGPGGMAPITDALGFDWTVDNALSEGGVTAINTFALTGVSPSFTTFSHGRLTALTTDSGPVSVPAGIEITFVSGFSERVSGFSTAGGVTTVLFDDGTGPINFFEIYLDTSPDADVTPGVPPSGSGYNDGKLIFTGSVDNVFSTTKFSIDDLNAGPLDSAGGNSFPLLETVGGAGDATVSGTVTGLDSTHFVAGLPLGTAFSVFTTELLTPFATVNPSEVFTKLPSLGVIGAPSTSPAPVLGGAGVGVPSLGTVNGLAAVIDPFPLDGEFGGPDFQFQQDGSQSFGITPEPTGLALWSIGALILAGRGARTWRRKK